MNLFFLIPLVKAYLQINFNLIIQPFFATTPMEILSTPVRNMFDELK